MPNLNHNAEATLFVMGQMELLIDRGMVEGKKLLTPKGVALFDQLKAAGFRPTESEVRGALAALSGAPSSITIDGDLVELVRLYHDERNDANAEAK